MGRVLRWGLFLALAAGVATVALRVDLTPRVESDFFFAVDSGSGGADPFGGSPAQLLFSIEAPDLDAPEYLDRIRAFSADLVAVPGIKTTIDVAHGPRSLKDARESPFWGRFLISEDGRATQMIVLMDGSPKTIVPRVEEIAARHDRPDFRISTSGVPYVVELITRHLFRDLKLFLFATLGVFGLLVLVLFRSWSILAGTLVACLGAVGATLGIQFACGVRPGILTGNVLTITFVMALSHIVFISGNWAESGAEVGRALKWTAVPSFWSMATTLLGFLTMLLATAKPLREFAIWASVGSLASMAAAYGIFPLYLRAASRRASAERAAAFFARGHRWAFVAILLLFAASAYGFRRIDRDPSLLSYFRGGGDIRLGLEAIDARTGSTPLDLVVGLPGAPRLTTQEGVRKLRALHLDLEKMPEIGVVVSIAVAVDEADRQGAWILPVDKRVDLLDRPPAHFGRLFLTPDRKYAKFMLRMHEGRTPLDREETVRRVADLARKHGFEVAYTAGLYEQMGRLSRLVISSVYRGLAGLLFLFVGVSFIVGRSWRSALGMIFGLVLVAGCTLGVIGLLRWPVDIISSTAVNVVVGMGIDGMIHIVSHVRRTGEGWARARARMAFPVLVSSGIVAGGFAIFALSSFPPTQRFGLFVVVGIALSAFVVLLVLPRPFARIEPPRPERPGSRNPVIE